MRLKRLHLFGFKSFADRTTFEFGDNTLTGVVGPNGCGKSNVVDSVRWVLGEQRPTSMRGAEMTDVIFKGSSSRPALSVAEVTLILDNASGALEGRASEVSITRRVFKSGEGEYLLDGDKVRLKDVREMLFDTGLGSRGYSVLEQGRIDAVLSANPLERRRIFEEAAGISRYRQRKVETEMRLKRVADDMTRLDDLLGELGTRVRSLKIQAGRAERFVAARDEWARERARSFQHRLWLYRDDLASLGSRAAELEERAARLRRSRADAEADVDVREKERTSLVSEVERLVSESARLSGDGRAIDERRAQLSARVASWKGSAREEDGRARTLAQALEEREREIARLAAELSELEQRARGSHADASTKAQALGAIERRWRDVRAAVEEHGKRVLALLAARTAAENRIGALEAARGPAEEREVRISERLAGAQGGVDELCSEVGALVGRAKQALDGQAQQEALRRDLAQGMADVAAAANDAEAEKKELELERARVQSRIDVLLDRERDLEELSAGAKRVLEGVAKRSEPCSSSELLGLVADHLRTDTQHARALDAVLGQRANALVAKSRDTAQLVLGWLKKREAGQVGLVLPAGIGAPPARATPPADPERILGALTARVRCASGFERLCALLCGDVLIARDLETALALAAEHPAWRFVTLEGEFVDAAGLHGGHRALTQGAVGRRSSAEELRGEVASLSARIEGLEEQRADLAERRVLLQKDWERSSQELEQRRAARIAAESQLATARARLADQEAGLRALEQESGAAGAERTRIERELAEARTRRDQAVSDHVRDAARLSAMDTERAELEGRREELARAEAQSQVEATRSQAELEGLARRVADLRRVRDENALESERAARLALEHGASAEKGEGEIEALARTSAAILVERAALDAKLSDLRSTAEAGRGLIESARKRVETVTHELEDVSAGLSTLRLEEQKCLLSRQEIVRRAQEDLAIEEATLLEGFEPEAALREPAALEALEENVRELKSRLDKIGPVNMEAMSELQEAAARLDFLEKQRADLHAARLALEQTIQTIDGESKRLFLETFEQVRANFQRIFRQLFGGGKADVMLEENVDVLDAGVEIVARPPGRELLSIGLLSGGQRTLTALALLFAVFEARPSPFCILDEVDAALDDANVERFLSMLDGFRQSTQFIVVTHNKGTMAACESLYGVTMETKGVSRQVAVELSEVDRWTGQPGAAPVFQSLQPATRSTARGAAVDAETGLPIVELVVPESSSSATPTNGHEAEVVAGAVAEAVPVAS